MGSKRAIARLAAVVAVVAVFGSGASAYAAPQHPSEGRTTTADTPQGTTATPAKPAPQRAAPSKPPVRPAASNGGERAYVDVNGGYQATANNFSNTWSFEYFVEPGSATGHYTVKPAFMFDVGGGVRVWRSLSIGAAASRYRRDDAVALSASVPYPFEYGRLRPAEGTAAGPSRSETAVHLDARWMLRGSPRMRVALFAGPSVFKTSQVLVSTLNFNDTYPYDIVAVSSVATNAQTRWSAGFNVGADIAYMFTANVGVGVLIRVARSSVELQAPDGVALSVNAGGVQAGAGVRFRFWKPSPPKPGVKKQPPGKLPAKK